MYVCSTKSREIEHHAFNNKIKIITQCHINILIQPCHEIKKEEETHSDATHVSGTNGPESSAIESSPEVRCSFFFPPIPTDNARSFAALPRR